MTKRILREPLTHFLLMAALIFVVHAWRGKDDPEGEPQDRIEVTAGTLSWLGEGFTKQWNRAPDESELRGLVETHIREEVLYREALELGLDRNDTIVRRRMAQKMEFLSQDIATVVEPDEAALRKFFSENAERYAKAAKISFRHVYFSKGKRGDKLDGDAKVALEALVKGANEETMGDPSLVPHEFKNADANEITASFGDNFTAELTTMPQGEWRGPVASSYGLHLTLVTGRSEPETVDFESVRDAVMRDLVEARRQQANQDFIGRLKQRYEIKVDEAALKEIATVRRNRSPMKLLTVIFAILISAASGHEVRPAFLELKERAPGEFDVLWKVPAPGGVPIAGEEIPHPEPVVEETGERMIMPCGCPAPTAAELSRGSLPIHPSLPKNSRALAPSRMERIFGAEIWRWTITTDGRGLDGWNVAIHGLETTMIDALVRIELADGRVVSRLLRPDSPSFVYTAETAGQALGGYFMIGVEHILLGIDHLLFVLGLLLIVKGTGLLVKTITAFTIAHSITLTLATLGHVSLPAAPVEAVIALSIVFVAIEIIRSKRGRPGLTERSPWLVAFVFGLLHGFGFAGALGELGLPPNDIPLALLLFNLGVEAGQLLFVSAVLVLSAPIRRMAHEFPRWPTLVPPYAIGGVAMVWMVERISSL